MKSLAIIIVSLTFTGAALAGEPAVTGELKQWHKVTLTLDGPPARETDTELNPFTDYRMTVTFEHESGSPKYQVPGYFAADGNAANTSAAEGDKWRAHFAPDKPGPWTYTISFVKGKQVAVSQAGGEAVKPLDGRTGKFTIAPTDKKGRDFRARGRLQYAGKNYLRFAGSGEYFLKAGADSPETLLAYTDFDGTRPGRQPNAPRREGEAAPAGLHRYEPHVRDWNSGDPTWKDGQGQGLIGALNYLDGKGVNSISFLPYNAGGDGDNVWPFVARDDKLHYDCSKLDQWGLVFDHAQALGLYLHFKLQEHENDDNRVGHKAEQGHVPPALDGGDLGVERRLYCRELIARFGHALALNWNLGEENTQSAQQQRAFARYLRDTDPYDHHIVVHTFPDWQDRVYADLLGDKSVLTGASLQNSWDAAHERTRKWVTESAKLGKPWVVANDEQGPAGLGVPPDPGYQGHSGKAGQAERAYDLHDIRKRTLWGNLLAGGAGVEYYFGYTLPQNDLDCEDFRSRDQSWDYCRIALDFLREHKIPFWEMSNHNALVGNSANDNSKYCFARPGRVYLVYLPSGGTAELDLADARDAFSVTWFNPRSGGALEQSSVEQVKGGGKVSLGRPPADADKDWLIVVRNVADTMVFPDKDWEEATPESQGVDSTKLADAVEYLKANAGDDGVRELVIVKNGRLIWKGDNIDKVHGVWSCTKSFTSTCLGLLIEDGKCALDTRAATLVPELAEHYPDITLRHFTTMTSGYRAVGDDIATGSSHGQSRTPFKPDSTPLFTPAGSQYAYWDSAMNEFALALTRSAGEPLETLFQRRIVDPIGMNAKNWDWGDWEKDGRLVLNSGSGNNDKQMHISAREMARLGHLFLNEGNWNGRQLISADWVRQATTVHVPATVPLAQPKSKIDGRGCYGFNWWVNGLKADGKRLWPGAPESTFAAMGHNNNKLFVIPEWRMVIVRLGLDQNDRKIANQECGEFLRLVGESIAEGH